MFQQCWDSGCIPQAWKLSLMKLVLKVASPELFHQCRPISLIGGLYKLITEVLGNRLQTYFPKFIHPAQYGFTACLNILHNVLNVQYYRCRQHGAGPKVIQGSHRQGNCRQRSVVVDRQSRMGCCILGAGSEGLGEQRVRSITQHRRNTAQHNEDT